MRKSLNRVASIATSAVMVGSMLLSGLPAHAAGVTGISETLTREKESVAGVTHVLTFTAAGAENGNLDVDYTGTASGLAFVSASCVTGTVVNNTTTGTGLHVTAAGCAAGLFTITFTGTNGLEGSHTLSLGGTFSGTGSWAVPLTTEDQITVTASVNPYITFEVWANTSANTCAAANQAGIDNTGTDAWGGSGNDAAWTVALGTLAPTTTVTSSDAGSIQHICTFVSTNAGSGYALTVLSANGGLISSAASHTIGNNGTTGTNGASAAAAGIESYGICAQAADSTLDTTVPTGTSATIQANFLQATCNSSSVAGAKLTTNIQPAAVSTSSAQDDGKQWLVKASIAATTPAASDYTDTLTWIATGTF